MRRPGLVAGPFLFSYYFYSIELSETKFQLWRIYFLACKGFRLFGFPNLIFEFVGFWGLTCDFAGIFEMSNSFRAAGDIKNDVNRRLKLEAHGELKLAVGGSRFVDIPNQNRERQSR